MYLYSVHLVCTCVAMDFVIHGLGREIRVHVHVLSMVWEEMRISRGGGGGGE